MQLTARQREFVRIAGWVLPVSITLGAVFGHFQAQNGSVWGYVQGAVTAIVISCAILLLEFAVFSRTRSALARRMPFLLYLALRSLGYLAAILMGLTVSAWLLRESAERPLIERGGVVFSLVLSLGFNLLIGVNDLLGQGVLFNFVAGRFSEHIHPSPLLQAEPPRRGCRSVTLSIPTAPKQLPTCPGTRRGHGSRLEQMWLLARTHRNAASKRRYLSLKTRRITGGRSHKSR